MAINCVGAQANELDISLCKLWLEFGERSELGCAHRSVVFRVREEDGPAASSLVSTGIQMPPCKSTNLSPMN